MPQQHIVILPYYCREEVSRYLRIADFLLHQAPTRVPFRFLLAASPRTEPDQDLYRAFSKLAPTDHFRCPTEVFGYPEGPTAMYWDCMDHVAERFGDCRGFSLWLESDMCPTRGDWLDRLSSEWFSVDPDPVMMGCYVPDVYKFRWLRRPKRLLESHINGGACYALNFAHQLPKSAREGVFDMSVYGHAQAVGRVLPTRQITFSTVARARRDRLDPERSLLHGFMQEKDQFIDECLRPLTPAEQRRVVLHSLEDQWDVLRRRVRVCFVRRGKEAMLENMLLTKQRLETGSRAA